MTVTKWRQLSIDDEMEELRRILDCQITESGCLTHRAVGPQQYPCNYAAQVARDSGIDPSSERIPQAA